MCPGVSLALSRSLSLSLSLSLALSLFRLPSHPMLTNPLRFSRQLLRHRERLRRAGEDILRPGLRGCAGIGRSESWLTVVASEAASAAAWAWIGDYSVGLWRSYGAPLLLTAFLCESHSIGYSSTSLHQRALRDGKCQRSLYCHLLDGLCLLICHRHCSPVCCLLLSLLGGLV